MWIVDINVLMYAHHQEVAQHLSARSWLLNTLQSGDAFTVLDNSFIGFIRAATMGTFWKGPSTNQNAIRFCDELRSAPGFFHLVPNHDIWAAFRNLCSLEHVRGLQIHDAYIAAAALARAGTVVTYDKDFAIFPALRWLYLQTNQLLTNPR